MSKDHGTKITEDLDLSIDPQQLDVEWLRQPRLMQSLVEVQANARMAVGSTKDQLSLVEADLAQKIRKSPEDFDLEKVTESSVKEVILLHEDRQQAAEALNQAQHSYDVVLGYVRACEHRKAALEDLVRLLGQGYFAGPIAPREIQDEWNTFMEQKQDKATTKRKVAAQRKRGAK